MFSAQVNLREIFQMEVNSLWKMNHTQIACAIDGYKAVTWQWWMIYQWDKQKLYAMLFMVCFWKEVI